LLFLNQYKITQYKNNILPVKKIKLFIIEGIIPDIVMNLLVIDLINLLNYNVDTS